MTHECDFFFSSGRDSCSMACRGYASLADLNVRVSVHPVCDHLHEKFKGELRSECRKGPTTRVTFFFFKNAHAVFYLQDDKHVTF